MRSTIVLVVCLMVSVAGAAEHVRSKNSDVEIGLPDAVPIANTPFERLARPSDLAHTVRKLIRASFQTCQTSVL